MNTVSMSLISAVILAVTLQEASGQKADLENVSYGPHERNVFDLWQAKADGPRPLVIYYHGGGFWAGDKSGLYGPLCMEEWLSSITIKAEFLVVR